MVEQRDGRRRTRRAALAVSLGTLGLFLSGCSLHTDNKWWNQTMNFGFPNGITPEGIAIREFWTLTVVTSLIVGFFVWGLIFWVVFRYRRKNNTEVPRQTRYNLPLEIMYTLVPFLIIGVLFFFTVRSQDAVLAKSAQPQHTVNVLGQKWSWTFNYMEQQNSAVGAVVHEGGTIEKIPDLYLPVNESVRFNLTSADVIHSFWIPEFLKKFFFF